MADATPGRCATAHSDVPSVGGAIGAACLRARPGGPRGGGRRHSASSAGFTPASRFIAAVMLPIGLAMVTGCASFMPSSGPESWDVIHGRPFQDTALPYALVPADAHVLDILATYTPRIANVFKDR